MDTKSRRDLATFVAVLGGVVLAGAAVMVAIGAAQVAGTKRSVMSDAWAQAAVWMLPGVGLLVILSVALYVGRRHRSRGAADEPNPIEAPATPAPVESGRIVIHARDGIVNTGKIVAEGPGAGIDLMTAGAVSNAGEVSVDQSEPEPSDRVEETSESSDPPKERIGYRVSGRARANPHNPHIRNQDVAFDVRDDACLSDTNSEIE